VIIPIGHDKGRRRLPVVTLFFIIACTLLQVQRTVAAPSAEELERKQEARFELIAAIVQDARRDHVEVDVEALVRGDYQGVDSPYVAELEQLDRDFAHLARKDLANRFGWSPPMGWSLTMILSAFVHAGWLHLIGNMLFLWLSGAAIEDRWGHVPFAAFYLGAAVVAAGAYALWNRGTQVPVVGASGAVAGCMGAFLIVYARVKIRFAYLWGWGWRYRTGTFEARALYALPIWFAEEALYSYFEARGMSGVAHSAHVGGFVYGMVIAGALKLSGVEAKHLVSIDELADDFAHRNPELEEGLRFERAGQKSSALVNFRKVLARDPQHATARTHALDCALVLRELEIVRELADAGVHDLLRDGRAGELPMFYKRMVDLGVADALGDRARAEIARLCLPDDSYAPLGVQIVRGMLEAERPSPFLPGLLWRVAEVQSAAGKAELAARTLAMLVERFPMDPFADRARTRLAADAAVATAGS
jgi:membrane associated rhomboid family serine protease